MKVVFHGKNVTGEALCAIKLIMKTLGGKMMQANILATRCIHRVEILELDTKCQKLHKISHEAHTTKK